MLVGALLDEDLQGGPQAAPALHDVALGLSAGDDDFSREEAQEDHGGSVGAVDEAGEHVFLVRAVQVEARVHRV